MNLVPFDLEAAKKDPSRVVLTNGDFFEKAGFHLDVFVGARGNSWYAFGPLEHGVLRLTAPAPRKVKVAVFKFPGGELWARTFEDNNGSLRQVSDWVEIEIKEVMG